MVVFAGAIAVALIIKTFVMQAFYIPSASMNPTLLVNDRVLVNKLSYRLHDINRGDVVVFEKAPDATGPEETKDLIKRVIGLPGESIAFENNKVYIDGQPLDEPYLPPGTQTTQNPAIPCTLPKPCKVQTGQVFVMGDNRMNSRDSRYIGAIPEDQVVGRAFTRVWPLNRLGGL
ncbi:MAG: signal peptidase I [Actinobacteria bacterium]|nr:signal peptidase I [Actinomycetota bacterium]